MTKAKKAIVVGSLFNLVVMIYMSTSNILGYILHSFPDVNPSNVILILTIPSLVGMVTAFLIGPLSLKIDKKILTICAMSALCAAMLIVWLSGGKSLGLMYLASVLSGLAQGSANTLIGAIIADYVAPAKRGQAIATTQIFLNIGGIIWNLAVGNIAAIGGGENWSRAYACGLFVLAMIIAVIVMYPKASDPEEAADIAAGDMPGMPGDGAMPEVPDNGKKLPGRVIAMSILLGGFSMFMFTFNMYISDYYINVLQLGSSSQVSIVSTLMTIGGMIAGAIYTQFNNIFKKMHVSAAFALTGIGLLMIAYLHNLPCIAIGGFLVGSGFILAFPYMMAEVSLVTSPKYIPVAMGVFNGVNQVVMFLAQYVLNPIAGIFANPDDAMSMMVTRFSLSGIVILILAVIAAFMFGGKKKEAPDQTK